MRFREFRFGFGYDYDCTRCLDLYHDVQFNTILLFLRNGCTYGKKLYFINLFLEEGNCYVHDVQLL